MSECAHTAAMKSKFSEQAERGTDEHQRFQKEYTTLQSQDSPQGCGIIYTHSPKAGTWVFRA